MMWVSLSGLFEKVAKAMRPSGTLNALIDGSLES